MSITPIGDVNLEILSYLRNKNLFDVFATSKRSYRLSENEEFWKKKVIKDYGEQVAIHKPPDESYSDQYYHLSDKRTTLESGIEFNELDVIIANFDETKINLDDIAIYTSPKVLDFFHNKGFDLLSNANFIMNAIGIGNQENVKWFLKKDITLSDRILEEIIINSDEEIRELLPSEYPFSIDLVFLSLMEKNYKAADWLIEKRNFTDEELQQVDTLEIFGDTSISESAIVLQDVQLLNWLFKHGIVPNDEDIAVIIGDEKFYGKKLNKSRNWLLEKLSITDHDIQLIFQSFSD